MYEIDSSEETDKATTPPPDPESIIEHVRVSAMAEYYKVEDLKQLAISKVQEVGQVSWNATAFMRAANYAITSTSEDELHDSMARAGSSHIKELLAHSDMEKLISPFGVRLLQSYVDRMEQAKDDLICDHMSLQRDLKSQRFQLDGANRQIESMYKSLAKCRNSLLKKRHCKNPNCRAEFPILLEHGVYDSEFRLRIRCSKCGSRR